MSSSLLHRVFAGIFGVWVAFFLRREPLSSFNFLHGTIVLFLITFLLFNMQASIVIRDNRERLKYLLPTIIISILTIGAVYLNEFIFFPKNPVPLQVIFFLASIIILWLGSNEVALRIYGDEEWLRE